MLSTKNKVTDKGTAYSGRTVKYSVVKATHEIINAPMKIELEVSNDASKNPLHQNKNLASPSNPHVANYKGSRYLNVRAIEFRKMGSMMAKFVEWNQDNPITSDMTPEVRNATMNLWEMPVEDFKFAITKEIIYHHDAKAQPQLPMQGEMIKCVIGYTKDKNGEYILDVNNQKMLEIKTYTIPQAISSTNFDWNTMASFMTAPKASDVRESIAEESPNADVSIPDASAIPAQQPSEADAVAANTDDQPF